MTKKLEEMTTAEKEAYYDELLSAKIKQQEKEVAAIRAKEEAEALKAQEDAQKAKELEIAERIKAQIEKDYNLVRATDSDPNLPDGGQASTIGGKQVDPHAKFAATWFKYETGLDLPKNKLVAYGGSAMQDYIDGAKFVDVLKASNSDSGCDDNVSAWTPADNYANTIWNTLVCKGMLIGKVTVRGLDVNYGQGGAIQIKLIGSRSAQGPLSVCECLSCESNTFSTYTVTIDVYGDLAEICEKDLFDAGKNVKTAVLESMSDALAVQLDAEVWTQLSGASPGYSQDSDASLTCNPSRGSDGDCCSYTANLYEAIVNLEADMRAASYRPDYIIMHPRVAAYLKFREGISIPGYIASQIKMDGFNLIGIGNLKVIEFCGATDCTDAGDAVMAIMIDSRRAVGEAWGKRPTFEQDRNIDCDSTTVAVHMYVGIDELDTGAIGHILNP